MKEFRKIPSTDYKYEISNKGVLRNVKSKHVVQGRVGKQGYYYTVIRVKGCNKTVKHHRLVAEVWFKDFNPKLHVHHKDHNKTNNNINNLELLEPSEHLKRHALSYPKDERIKRAKNASEGMTKAERSKLGKKNAKYFLDENGQCYHAKKVYTSHNGKILEFDNSVAAQKWVKDNYPEYVGNNLAGNIRCSARGAYKGLAYKHKWYHDKNKIKQTCTD